MDENSREETTLDTTEEGKRPHKVGNVPQMNNVGVRIHRSYEKTAKQVSDRCGSSFEASVSGPSIGFCPPETETDKTDITPSAPPEQPELKSEQNNQPREDASNVPQLQDESIQENVKTSSNVPDLSKIGPPPSYSFVMKQKKKPQKPESLPEVKITERPLPPTYSGNERLCFPPELNPMERRFNISSFAEPLWRSHSQPALCPRCGILILTTTHAHESVGTHVAALALCLFGCWPCCLLPYCLNVCKNTYHHCPICHTFLGSYSPW